MQNVSFQPTKIIEYWRNFIADEDRIGISKKDLINAKNFTNNELHAGKINSKLTTTLFKEFLARNKHIEKKDLKSISVLIAPMILMKKFKHGETIEKINSQNIASPLWIAANLTENGNLTSHSDNILPWIDRRCLKPNESDIEFPIIGTVDKLDEYYTNTEIRHDNRNWSELLDYSSKLIKYVSSDKYKELIYEQNYEIQQKACKIRVHSYQNGAAQNIIKTLDQYIKHKRVPETLKKLIKPNTTEKNNVDYTEPYLKSHIGQMSSKFSLSKTQRESLYEYFMENKALIFALNGPPGTGKTTFIQTLIANELVKSALKNKSHPPLIVCTSKNNQAITNILDTFKSIDCKRWLPNIDSFGLYLAATGKNTEANKSGYLYKNIFHNSGNIEDFYTEDYQTNAKKYYLDKVSKYFDKNVTELEHAQTLIHTKMRYLDEKIKSLIDLSTNFKTKNNELLDIYEKKENIAKTINKLNTKIEQLNERVVSLEKTTVSWLNFWNKDLFWLRFFKWIPFISKVLNQRIELFALENNLSRKSLSIEDEINNHIFKTKRLIEILQNELSLHRDFKDNYDLLEKQWSDASKKYNFHFNIFHSFDFDKDNGLQNILDTKLRSKLFQLSVHYWEAQWLLQANKINSFSHSENGRFKHWSVVSMLTPCLITTLHSGPAFFSYRAKNEEYETLENFIDLLIIDEAGQVNPAESAPMIGASKKVVIVGDIFQLKPVVLSTRKIDVANFKRYSGLSSVTDYNQLAKAGLTCVNGNVMKLAQNYSSIEKFENGLKGSYLLDHRRCYPEIISYCSELCYDGQLIPRRLSEDTLLPKMGYAHIKGVEVDIPSGGKKNTYEIIAVFQWLKKNQDKILNYYKNIDSKKYSSLSDCVGIITPFRQQGEEIKHCIDKYKIDIKKFGTVHTFQGAEMPIIIFSSVYNYKGERRYFFDYGPNMLNVAVSRAKDSFLVFGDTDIFNPLNSNTPSGKLAKYLFSNEENELLDIEQPKFNNFFNDVYRIDTLEGHRQTLINSFSEAQNELIIVSPFLRTNALKSDKIIELINLHKSRIKIKIYVDKWLNQGQYANDFEKAINLIKQTNIEINIINNIHSKIIMIDDRVIIEGSFNWLSASRDNKKYIREESSLTYSGSYASRFIAECKKLLNDKL